MVEEIYKDFEWLINRYTLYPTQAEITFERMKKYEAMEKKFIYPDVKVSLEVEVPNGSSGIQLETYIRLLHEGQYYLCKCFRDNQIRGGINRDIDMISCIKQFYAEVYRHQQLMIVDLKMVMPQHMGPGKPVFELDSDQTPEKERLILK